MEPIIVRVLVRRDIHAILGGKPITLYQTKLDDGFRADGLSFHNNGIMIDGDYYRPNKDGSWPLGRVPYDVQTWAAEVTFEELT